MLHFLLENIEIKIIKMAEGGELRKVEQIRFSEDDTEGQTEKIDTQKIDRIDYLSFLEKHDDRDLEGGGGKTWAE